jgi:lipopolysaccharide export system protein LptC
MKPRANTLFPVLLLAGLTGLSFWLDYAVRQEEQGAKRSQLYDPDFIVENFDSVSLNEAGKPASTLKAKRMTHYPGNQASKLDTPYMVQLRENGASVHISAERGLVSGSGEEVRLYGNVVVRRLATAERAELRLETRFLQVLPEQDLARTPEHVVIIQGGSRLTGVGLEINSKTEEFILKSQVSGQYVKAPS